MRAPTDIKIDGKTTEWGDKFQAYNVNNHIYYTIANDDDNLYLVIKTNDPVANEKAIFGITFTINLPIENNKKSKNNVSIMFPTVIAVQQRDPIRTAINALKSRQKETKDSLLSVVNNKINNNFKEINVKGINSIQQSTLAINNDYGIKAGAQIDNDLRYTYELLLPLKYLGSNINSGQKFRYNIKLNGIPQKSPDSPYAAPMVFPDGGNFLAPDTAFTMYATDFWCEYVLAKQ